jgi:hypothetical protein
MKSAAGILHNPAIYDDSNLVVTVKKDVNSFFCNE